MHEVDVLPIDPIEKLGRLDMQVLRQRHQPRRRADAIVVIVRQLIGDLGSDAGCDEIVLVERLGLCGDVGFLLAVEEIDRRRADQRQSGAPGAAAADLAEFQGLGEARIAGQERPRGRCAESEGFGPTALRGVVDRANGVVPAKQAQVV